MDFPSLAHGALHIASIEFPDLDVNKYLGELDTLAGHAATMFSWDASAFEQIRSFNHFMFEHCGFFGNHEDYYNPHNSCLNAVLDHRGGIPITLSIVYIEIARRLGLPVEGVNFPGHFLVKWDLDDGIAVVDPYAGGVCLDTDDLDKILKRLAGDEAPTVVEMPALLSSVEDDAILVRVLRNLKAIYAKQEQSNKVLASLDQILALRTDANAERLERAALYEQLECYQGAINDLEALSAERITGSGQHADSISESLERLRQANHKYH